MIKKLLFAGVLALAFNSSKAQIVLFEDGFESYTDFAISGIGNWTLKDVDLKNTYSVNGYTYPNQSVPKSFMVFNKSSSQISPAIPSAQPQFQSRTGNKHLICWNATSSPWNNDWAITPQIQLGLSGNKVSFYAKSAHQNYGEEKFNVLISTTGTEIADFTPLNPNLIVTPADVEWYEYSFDLDAYAGQQIYIAIQCLSDDQFALQIDDFKVTATTLATSEVSKNKLSIYPNPAVDFLNIKSATKIEAVEIFDISGRKVSNFKVVDGAVDVRSLDKGTYIIKTTSNGEVTTQKFIKK